MPRLATHTLLTLLFFTPSLLASELTEPLAVATRAWEERQNADHQTAGNRDFHLLLDEVLAGHTCSLHLYQRGGRFVRARLDPLPDPASQLKPTWHVLGVDCSKLVSSEGSLTGSVAIRWRWQTQEQIGGHIWERTNVPQDRQEHLTTISFSGSWRADLQEAELRLPAAVDGKDIVVHLTIDGGAVSKGQTTTPKWNRGLHETAVSGLSVTNAGLSGRLGLVLHPDNWVPKDKKPRRQSVELKATLGISSIGGSFTSSGDLGTPSGELSGSLRTPLTGVFQAQTDDQAEVFGPLAGATAPAEPAASPPPGKGPVAQYRQLAWLAEAQASYPAASLPILIAEPIAGASPAWLRLAEQVAKTAGAPEQPVAGIPVINDPEFGPYTTTGNLAGTAERGSWQRLEQWTIAGPFPLEPSQRGRQVLLPEVLPVAGGSYTDPFARADAGDAGQAIGTSTGSFRFDRALGSSKDPGNKLLTQLYYGHRQIDLAEAATCWIAIRLSDSGRLWIDGRLVWTSSSAADHYDQSRYAIFPIDLTAGSHDLIVRSENHNEDQFVDCCLLVGGGPATADQIAARQRSLRSPATRGFRGDGSARYPDATPPISWDVASGDNIRWSLDLPPGWSDPVLMGDSLFTTAEPNLLVAVDPHTGDKRWEQTIGEVQGKGPHVSTPTVTADRIVTQLGNGTLGCFDHAGTGLWSASTGFTPQRGPALPGPVIIGDLVVASGSTGSGKKPDAVVVAAWKLSDGSPAWRLDPLPLHPYTVTRINGKWDTEWYRDGTAATINGLTPVILGNGRDERHLLVSSHGHLIDAQSGELIRQLRVAALNRCAPYVDGSTCYFTAPIGESALDLWLDDAGRIGARTRWSLRRRFYLQPPEDSLQSRTYWHKGPVVRDGLLYVQRTHWGHWPKHHPKPLTEVSTHELADGHLHGRAKKVLSRATNPANNPASAGPYLYFSDSGDGKYDGTQAHGQIAVALPGRQPLVINDNQVPRHYATPIFAGELMYLRTLEGLLAIGRSSDGKAEQEAIADYILDRLPAPPRPTKLTEISPPADLDPANIEAPLVKLTHKVMPDDWLVLGPLPAGKTDPLAAVGGLMEAIPTRGLQVGEQSFVDLDRSFLKTSFNVVVYWQQRPAETYQIDLGKLTKRKASTLALGTIWYCNSDQCLQLAVKSSGGAKAQFVLSGTMVKPKQALRLKAGFHPLVVRLDQGSVPKFIKGVEIEFFSEAIEDPAAAARSWHDQVAPYRQQLEDIAEELPDHPAAGKARMLLERLGKP